MTGLPPSADTVAASRLIVLEAWYAAPDRPLNELLRDIGSLGTIGNQAALVRDLLSELAELRRVVGTHADVILFRASGKYYTEEQWAVPADAIGPYDMDRSPDFRRISDGGAVLITDQRWGFPHLFPSEETPR